MLIDMFKVKLNRFFRRSMLKETYPGIDIVTIPDNELDDLENMYAGCAFE